MEILEIPKETQALICGSEELFSADLTMYSKQTDAHGVVCNCVFFRKEVYRGLERLSYIEGVKPSPFSTVFGYYDRANNRLNYYRPGMETKDKEFSFQLGIAGAKNDLEVNNFAIELIDSFLFTPDGELNQEELEQLAIDFCDVKSNKDTILWFAQMLFPHPEKSFRELLLTDISQTLLKNTPLPLTQIVVPFDKIAIVKFLEGTEEGELFMRRVARDLVCKFDGAVAKGLLSAWKSFLAAQKGIRESTEEQFKTT